MGLTQISTGGVKDDAISAGKIPANSVGSSEIADDAVGTAQIADDAVGTAQIADDGVAQAAVADEAIDEARLQISNAGTNGQFLQKQSGNTGGLTWAAANEYTHPNHSGEVTSTADGAQVIASDVVDEDNLKISNSGTNGQFLQKQSGNTGGLTWADVTIPPAGNTFTATADGSIANNKAVKIKSDGKVSEIKVETQARLDAAYVADGNLSTSGTDYQWSMSFYDSTMNRAIFVYYVDGNIKGRIGEPNSTTEPSSFSFGTEATLFSGVDQSGFDACYDTNTQRVVLFIRNGSGNGQCKVCVPTGGSTNTIAGGSTANVIGAVESVGVTYEPTSQKVIFVAEWGSNRIVKSQVGTVTGGSTNSISLETSQFMIADNSAHRYYFYNIVPLTANKFLAIGEKSSDNYLYAFVGSISGTTVTWESPVAISTATGQWCTAGFNTTTNHITFVWRNTSTGRPFYRPATLSGTTITFGSIDILYNININASAKHVRCWYEPTSDTTCIAYHNASDNKMWFERHLHESGTTAPTSVRRNNIFDQSLLYVGDVAVIGSTGRSLFAFHRGNADKNVWFISNHTEDATNYTASHQYVGFADQAYTNGQTATIKTYGNNVTSLSGLTAGSKYYVAKDGTLSTSQDNTLGFASGAGKGGVALSSSKLLITSPD